jgi:hypothetical protein
MAKLSCDISAPNPFDTRNSTNHWQKFVIGNGTANYDKVQIFCRASF